METTIDKVKATIDRRAKAAATNPMPVILIVGGLIGGYYLIKALRGLSNTLDLSDDPGAGGGGTTTQNPGQVSQGATITNTQAKTIAATLLSAMDGFGGMGSNDFLRMKAALAGKNAHDFNLISKEFGTPRRSIFTGEESIAILGGEKLSLSQWISKEASDSQLAELRQIIPGVF
ncbi:hypothetical protein [Robiginitalea biformata]|uniref:Uncharacterized protein n=1 Tax=Robiginitalea biformata (strain ATCC BAA-864 / DSM 15991 / KCTC 12146 / HTCC2501) TaxID=313596 RepID=A4CKN8_ROBBH|nr:hypothetical protein [Robiginitalea biformata]EAR15437.1 hypothetical protein RB2501_13954 [Robiginitalea biformata HTCC2501]